MTRRAASASLTSSRSDKENAIGSGKKRVSQSFSDRPESSSLLKRTLSRNAPSASASVNNSGLNITAVGAGKALAELRKFDETPRTLMNRWMNNLQNEETQLAIVVSPGQVFSQEVERQSQKEEKRKRIQEKVETSATNDERKSTSLGLDSLESNGLEASIDPELEVRRPALKLRQSTVNVHRYDQKSTSTSVNPSDSIPEETIDEINDDEESSASLELTNLEDKVRKKGKGAAILKRKTRKFKPLRQWSTSVSLAETLDNTDLEKMTNKKSVPLTRRAVKNSKAASDLTSDEDEDDSELEKMMNKKSVPLTRRAVKNAKAASALTSDEEEDDSELEEVMSKKVALKRRKTIARTPTKTKEACPVRNDGNDEDLEERNSKRRRLSQKVPRLEFTQSSIEMSASNDSGHQRSNNLSKDDEVALMQSPQLETELSRRGSLARKILRKTPNRSGNEVSSPDQDDEEEATLLNSNLHNSTLVQELSNVEEQTSSKRVSLVRRSARKTPNRTPLAGASVTQNSSVANTPWADSDSTLQKSGVIENEEGKSNRSLSKQIPDEVRPSDSTANEEKNDDSSNTVSDDDLEEQINKRPVLLRRHVELKSSTKQMTSDVEASTETDETNSTLPPQSFTVSKSGASHNDSNRLSFSKQEANTNKSTLQLQSVNEKSVNASKTGTIANDSALLRNSTNRETRLTNEPSIPGPETGNNMSTLPLESLHGQSVDSSNPGSGVSQNNSALLRNSSRKNKGLKNELSGQETEKSKSPLPVQSFNEKSVNLNNSAPLRNISRRKSRQETESNNSKNLPIQTLETTSSTPSGLKLTPSVRNRSMNADKGDSTQEKENETPSRKQSQQNVSHNDDDQSFVDEHQIGRNSRRLSRKVKKLLDVSEVRRSLSTPDMQQTPEQVPDMYQTDQNRSGVKTSDSIKLRNKTQNQTESFNVQINSRRDINLSQLASPDKTIETTVENFSQDLSRRRQVESNERNASTVGNKSQQSSTKSPAQNIDDHMELSQQNDKTPVSRENNKTVETIGGNLSQDLNTSRRKQVESNRTNVSIAGNKSRQSSANTPVQISDEHMELSQQNNVTTVNQNNVSARESTSAPQTVSTADQTSPNIDNQNVRQEASETRKNISKDFSQDRQNDVENDLSTAENSLATNRSRANRSSVRFRQLNNTLGSLEKSATGMDLEQLIEGKKGILKRRKVGTAVRPDENGFVRATTPLTRVATATSTAVAPMTTGENTSSGEHSKSKHNPKNKTFEVEKKAENEISANATPTSERRRNLQKSKLSDKTLEIVEQQRSSSFVQLDNQTVETRQQKELSRESQRKDESQRTFASGGHEVSGGFPYRQDPSENEVTFTIPVNVTRMRSAPAENDVATPSASGSRNMSGLDINDVTFSLPRKTGAAIPEHVSAADDVTTKGSVQFKYRTLANAANQVGNVSSMLSPIEGVGRLRNRFFTPRVSRHLIPAPDEDDDDVGPKDCEGDDLDPDVLAILEDNPQETDYALPFADKVSKEKKKRAVRKRKKSSEEEFSPIPKSEAIFHFQRFSGIRLAKEAEPALMEAVKMFNDLSLRRLKTILDQSDRTTAGLVDIKQLLVENGFIPKKERCPNWSLYSSMHRICDWELRKELIPGVGNPNLPDDIWNTTPAERKESAADSDDSDNYITDDDEIDDSRWKKSKPKRKFAYCGQRKRKRKSRN